MSRNSRTRAPKPGTPKTVAINEDEIRERGQLGDRARHRLDQVLPKLDDLPIDDIPKLIEELRIHQVELEMQNEELRRAQAELQTTRDRYYELFDFAPVGYFTLDANGLIKEVNISGADLLGYTRHSLLRNGFSRLIAPDAQEVYYHHCKEVYQTRAPQSCEVQLRRKDGSFIYAQLTTNVEYDDKGNCCRLRMTVTDITRRRQAEDSLQEAHARLEFKVSERTAELMDTNRRLNSEIEAHRQAMDQIRGLTHQLIRVQESERLMISRELHDSLAQELTAAKLLSENLLNPATADFAHQTEKLKTLAGILAKAIVAVRDLAYGLRPNGLKQFGLVYTLLQHCRDFEETQGIQVDFQAAGIQKIAFDDETAINLYRLVQEGLANIKKHAAASQVKIRFVYAFPHITLRIKDNGRGFDVRQRQATLTSERKLGLRSMQERVELMKGTMKIESKPGCGARLSIKIPFEG